MHKQPPVSDPFAMLMDLQSVVQAMERSDRLARLQSRICRPLDKPILRAPRWSATRSTAGSTVSRSPSATPTDPA